MAMLPSASTPLAVYPALPPQLAFSSRTTLIKESLQISKLKQRSNNYLKQISAIKMFTVSTICYILSWCCPFNVLNIYVLRIIIGCWCWCSRRFQKDSGKLSWLHLNPQVSIKTFNWNINWTSSCFIHRTSPHMLDVSRFSIDRSCLFFILLILAGFLI